MAREFLGLVEIAQRGEEAIVPRGEIFVEDQR